MLIGRRFKLRVATIAIDGDRVTVMIPAGTTVQVVSDSCESTRMVDVLTDGRIFVMFVLDVMERGDEIVEPPLLSENEVDSIRLKLSSILDDIPSAFPTPDGTDRIRRASVDSLTQKKSFDALTRLSNFTIHGAGPPKLERRPSAKETTDSAINKRGAG